MSASSSRQAELELLSFLSDPNSQVRQLAVQNVVSFSVKSSSSRSLLISNPSTLIFNGKRLMGRDGAECDPIRDLKALCKDQPIAAHDAFSALINLSDSYSMAARIAGESEQGEQQEPFLTFLVQYIADPVSLLADLACMLLSNLTKFEPIAARLLHLQVRKAAFYNFISMAELNDALKGMEVDPSAPNAEEERRKAEQAQKKLQEQMLKQQQQSQEVVPALARLLDAFEEGATVSTNESALEVMKKKVAEAAQQQQGQPSSSSGKIKRKSNCNFLASVFANVSILPIGRDWFVQPLKASKEQKDGKEDLLEYPVARIAPYTEHPDLIRRGGVISALKNILFIKSAHPLLIAPPEPLPENAPPHLVKLLKKSPRPAHTDVDLLPYLLLPLTDGSELSKLDMEDQESLPEACQFIEEDKKRERDPALRLMLVECLLLLSTGLYGRECLRHRGAYIVVREAHLREQDEQITEAVVRLVNILKRDESDSSLKELSGGDAGEEEDDDDDDDDEAGQAAPSVVSGTGKFQASNGVKNTSTAVGKSGGSVAGEIDVGHIKPPSGSSAAVSSTNPNGTNDAGGAADEDEEDEDDEDLIIEEL